VPSHLDFSQGCPAIDDLNHCGDCACGYMRPPSKGWASHPTQTPVCRPPTGIRQQYPAVCGIPPAPSNGHVTLIPRRPPESFTRPGSQPGEPRWASYQVALAPSGPPEPVGAGLRDGRAGGPAAPGGIAQPPVEDSAHGAGRAGASGGDAARVSRIVGRPRRLANVPWHSTTCAAYSACSRFNNACNSPNR
jgi:hypothetical protein